MLARSCSTPTDRTEREMQGLISLAERRHPGLVKKMIRTPRQARQDNRRLGITPAPGETHQGYGVSLPPEFDNAMAVFAKKLGKAIFYMETKTIFPATGTLMFHWFTNAQLKDNNGYPAIELMDEQGAKIPAVQNGNRFLDDQFSYRVNISAEQGLFAVGATFNSAFGFVVFGCVAGGPLEAMVRNLEAARGTASPFQVLQSA
jgi:hypothetical protein